MNINKKCRKSDKQKIIKKSQTQNNTTNRNSRHTNTRNHCKQTLENKTPTHQKQRKKEQKIYKPRNQDITINKLGTHQQNHKSKTTKTKKP